MSRRRQPWSRPCNLPPTMQELFWRSQNLSSRWPCIYGKSFNGLHGLRPKQASVKLPSSAKSNGLGSNGGSPVSHRGQVPQHQLPGAYVFGRHTATQASTDEPARAWGTQAHGRLECLNPDHHPVTSHGAVFIQSKMLRNAHMQKRRRQIRPSGRAC